MESGVVSCFPQGPRLKPPRPAATPRRTLSHPSPPAAMKLTPLDIRKKDFGRSLRGYDPEEVEAFLDMVEIGRAHV